MKVLTVIPRYVPGYKAGGPVRTIANLVAWLGIEFEFFILTADRDLGDVQPYPGIQIGTWQVVGKAQVCYLPPDQLRWWTWPKRLQQIDYDVLYLNGFFAPTTRHLLWLQHFGLIPAKPIIVAPRGEFAVGALALKQVKKQWYLRLFKWLRLGMPVVWQASSEFERHDIIQTFAARSAAGCMKVIIAPNLPRSATVQPLVRTNRKQGDAARLIFLGRISRMKNLDYALQVLQGIHSRVELDIYGPCEDKRYWADCEELIRQLPATIGVTYRGELPSEQVSEKLQQYHALLLPTRGENFGHAILEALRSGCVVIISDRTQWHDLEAAQAGWDLPLEQPAQFRAAIERIVAMDEAEFSRWSQGAQQLGERFATNPAVLEANRLLFLSSER